MCKHTGFHTPSHYSATSDTHPPVGGGVLDAPWVAIQYGVIWTGKPSSLDVGEGVLTLPLAVRREILVRMGGLYNPRFRKPPRKGGRGRPPLQREWDGCEIYAAERIRIVTHDMMRGGSSYIPTFPVVPRKGRRGRRPLRLVGKRTFQQPYDAVASGNPRGVGDAAPYGWFIDLSRPFSHPRGSIRPRGVKRRKSQKGGWLHKTPGAEKTKKPKRVARGFYAF